MSQLTFVATQHIGHHPAPADGMVPASLWLPSFRPVIDGPLPRPAERRSLSSACNSTLLGHQHASWRACQLARRGTCTRPDHPPPCTLSSALGSGRSGRGTGRPAASGIMIATVSIRDPALRSAVLGHYLE
jgi:hypothetical protein